jgi:hypothetical protein
MRLLPGECCAVVKFFLVIVTLNPYGHAHYSSEAFPIRERCEFRRVQLTATHASIKDAYCIEVDPTHYSPPMKHVAMPETK